MRWIIQTKSDRAYNQQKDYFTYFWYGRYLRDEGRWQLAEEAFNQAAELADNPADKDAALWYALEASWKNNANNGAQAFVKIISLAQDPSYFSDLLEPISREAIAKRDGKAILLLENQGSKKLLAKDSARLSYICARSIQEGIINNEQFKMITNKDPAEKDAYIIELFQKAYKQKADPWYRLLAAYKLKLPLLDPLYPLEEVSVKKQKFDTNENDEIISYAKALIKFGLAYKIRQELGSDFAKLDPGIVREAAKSLYEYGHTEDAYRLIATQFWKADFRPSIVDAELYWPRPYKELFLGSAEKYKININLLYGLARTESAFNKNAVSRSGAVGLLQLMPATANEMAGRLKITDYDLSNPEQNLTLGAYYFQRLLDSQVIGKRVMAAICSYNAGPTRFRNWENQYGTLPMDILLEVIDYAETRQYGRNVAMAAINYASLYGEEDIQSYFAWLLGDISF